MNECISLLSTSTNCQPFLSSVNCHLHYIASDKKKKCEPFRLACSVNIGCALLKTCYKRMEMEVYFL
jgi:hypothetical protein